MLDPETFLTELYVLADDWCNAHPPPEGGPGPAPALCRSEALALACFGQWGRFPSEAAFYRWAAKHLRPLFPGLPSRPQLNRLLRRHAAAIAAFAAWLGGELAADGDRAYEALDGTGVRVRNARRRGAGWLAGLADVGWCTRLGWYEGVRLLLSVTPRGAVTGWGVGPASAGERDLAETFFAARAAPQPGLPEVGRPTSDRYATDAGFGGRAWEARWREAYGAAVVCPPKRNDRRRAWPKPLRRWLASIRQVVESVTDRLLTGFRLDGERPHGLDGLRARLAAKVALHNACCWLNRKLGRPDLAFADLVSW